MITFFLLSTSRWASIATPRYQQGFQDTKIRLPELFNENFVVKMMEFRWYCRNIANRQRLAFHESPPFFQTRVAYFKHFSISGHLCSSNLKLALFTLEKHYNSNWYFTNDQLNCHESASKYKEIWDCKAWDRGADTSKGFPLSFPEFSKIPKKLWRTLRDFQPSSPRMAFRHQRHLPLF